MNLPKHKLDGTITIGAMSVPVAYDIPSDDDRRAAVAGGTIWFESCDLPRLEPKTQLNLTTARGRPLMCTVLSYGRTSARVIASVRPV